jgi:hypothetical protein
MARPRRRHPLIRHHESPEAIALVRHVAGVLGGFEYRAVDQAGDVTVFRVDGPNGSGLLADRSRQLPDPPGVSVLLVSAWVRAAVHEESWLLDARLHAWDAGTEAAATGDRSVVDGPRRARYRVRDARTAEVALGDSVAVSELPRAAVPAFVAGLPADRVRALATRHAPELLA